MRKYFVCIFLVALISCHQKRKALVKIKDASLEINFTSKNNDSIKEIEALYLASITKKDKRISFNNIKCVTPNKFIFKPIDSDTFIALMHIRKDGIKYNVPIQGIIVIDSAINIISQELNLGNVRLK